MNTKFLSAGVGLAVLAMVVGFGLNASAKGQPTDVPRGPKATPTPAVVNVACIQSAIVERDNSVIAAVDAYHTAVVSALTARRNAFSAAWAITDRMARKEALKEAIDDFRSARKAAGDSYRTAKENAWKEFAKDRKACGVGAQDGHGNSKLDAGI